MCDFLSLVLYTIAVLYANLRKYIWKNSDLVEATLRQNKEEIEEDGNRMQRTEDY